MHGGAHAPRNNHLNDDNNDNDDNNVDVNLYKYISDLMDGWSAEDGLRSSSEGEVLAPLDLPSLEDYS